MYIVYLGEYFQTITKHPRRSHATNLNNNSYKERKADHVVVYTSTYTYIRATNQLTNQHNNSCPCRHSLREPCESQEEYNVVTAPATASSLFSEHLYHRNDARIPPRVLLCFCCWCCCRLCWRFLHCRWMIFLVLRYKATQFVWLWCKRALTQSHSLFDSLLQHLRRQQSVAVAENKFWLNCCLNIGIAFSLLAKVKRGRRLVQSARVLFFLVFWFLKKTYFWKYFLLNSPRDQKDQQE